MTTITLKIRIFVLALLTTITCGITTKSYAQFTAGLKFTSTSMDLLHADHSDNIYYDLNISSSGLGPSFNMDSKRFMFQGYVVKHFTTYGSDFVGTTSSLSQKRKPSETGASFGYKINANKDIKFTPFINLNVYNFSTETEVSTPDGVTTYRDRFLVKRFGGGVMAQYYYKCLVFDMSIKLNSASLDTGSLYFSGLSYGVDLGVGFNFGWVPKEPKKE